MTDISFYHLLHQPLETALPRLLEKVREAGLKAVIKAGSDAHVAQLDDLLWDFSKNSFLAHGTAKDKAPAAQPLYLTTEDENPAAATVLVMVDGVTATTIADYNRCLELFDGTDPTAVAAARDRWKNYTAAGHTLTYWQQTPQGGWQKKAT